MKLYSAPLSLFARKVEIALREKGLAFERVMVPFSQERGYAPKHPDVLAANPKGQVPVLVDGDLTPVRFHRDPRISGGRLSRPAALPGQPWPAPAAACSSCSPTRCSCPT